MSLIVFIIILSNLHLKHNRMVRFLDAFLDALLMRTNGKLETVIFCAETNIDIYLHWRSFLLHGKRYIKYINSAFLYGAFQR